MKKQLLTLISFSTLIIAYSCSKSNSNDDKPDNEKKLIKIEAVMTPFKFGQPSAKDKFRWARNEFDENGNIILITKRVGTNDLDGSKSYEDITTFKYESKKIVEKKDDTYRYQIKYSGSDTTEVLKYSSSGLVETKKYEYLNGKVSSVKIYWNSPELSSIENFSYTGNNLTAKTVLYKPFTTGNRLEYTYDSHGNMLTETYINVEKNTSNIQAIRAFKYDTNGNITEFIKNVFYLIQFRKWENTYNDNGLLIQQKLYEGNSLDGSFEQVGIIDFMYSYK